jgi:hypothetical protein
VLCSNSKIHILSRFGSTRRTPPGSFLHPSNILRNHGFGAVANPGCAMAVHLVQCICARGARQRQPSPTEPWPQPYLTHPPTLGHPMHPPNSHPCRWVAPCLRRPLHPHRLRASSDLHPSHSHPASPECAKLLFPQLSVLVLAGHCLLMTLLLPRPGTLIAANYFFCPSQTTQTRPSYRGLNAV